MNYSKLSKEAYKLYLAFIDAYFDYNQAFELTKFCIKEFPIFREMINEDDVYDDKLP